jgi:hypothetical protein
MLKQRAQTTNPKLEQHKEPPAHMQAPKHTSPELMQQCNTGMQQGAKTCSLCPGRLEPLHQAVRPPTKYMTAWGAVRPPHVTGPAPNYPKFAAPIGTPSKCSQVPKSCTNFSPLLTMHESRAKCRKFQHIASQIYKIHHKVLRMSK